MAIPLATMTTRNASAHWRPGRRGVIIGVVEVKTTANRHCEEAAADVAIWREGSPHGQIATALLISYRVSGLAMTGAANFDTPH